MKKEFFEAVNSGSHQTVTKIVLKASKKQLEALASAQQETNCQDALEFLRWHIVKRGEEMAGEGVE